MGTKESLIEKLSDKGVLRTPSIRKAFLNIDRADFVSPGMEEHAYYNIPLPIGNGQTISQPLTVAFMLELLQPQFSDKVLDIGSGSGWQTALLAHIVSHRPEGVSSSFKPGKVISIELISKLHEFSLGNLEKYKFIDNDIVQTNCMNAMSGCSDEAPFDRIICAASVNSIPVAWKEQLNPGGAIVTPVGSSVVALYQKDEGTWEQKDYPGFAFVPFIEE